MNTLLNRFLFLSVIASVYFTTGCQAFKSEDEKISDALVGRFYEDDMVEDGGKVKDISSVYFQDGSYKSEATLEFVDDETLETSSVKMKFTGTWKVKNKFLYNTLDKIESEPEYFATLLEESLRKKNTPSKIISYDDAKIQYEDSDGDRHFMKKTF